MTPHRPARPCRQMFTRRFSETAALGAAVVLLALAVLRPGPASGQGTWQPAERSGTYRFVYDVRFKGSMESGIAQMWNADLLLYRGVNWVADKYGFHETPYARPLLIPALLRFLPTPHQFIHDYYGHGSALREFGYTDITYRWNWFDRSSRKSQAVSWRIQSEGTLEENQLWTAGGLASTQLYLLEAEKDMYRSGRMTLIMTHPVQASQKDLSYLSNTLDTSRTRPAGRYGDGDSWRENFARMHGNDTALAADYAKKARGFLRASSTLNPSLYWLFATWAHYLWTGDDSFYAPMLPVAGYRFGFSLKANLTPLGPESYSYLFAGRGGRLAAIYIRRGKSPDGDIKGFGAEFGPVNFAGLSLTPGFDKWKLPSVSDPAVKYSRSGGSVQLKLDAPVSGSLGITGKAAYKTKGYMLGLPARAGPYGYAGISLTF